MANHLRRQIRERCASTLSGLSTTGTKVFQSRIYPMESAGLPGLCIYTQNEDVSIDAIGATRRVGRDLELIVEGYATGSNLDDTLDQIGKEVETALAGDIGFNSLAVESSLTGVEINYSGDGEKPTGVIKHTHSVYYRNLENTPDSAI